MITYDEAGTTRHTVTNVDPIDYPGYGPHLSEGMQLNQNIPNPFDTLTAITFAVPDVSSVTLKVYDMNGRVVRTLLDSIVSSGEHTVTWDARSDDGKLVRSLLYLCKLEVGTCYHTIVMSQVWPEESE